MANIQHIVRIANTDLKGSKETVVALTKVKGVGVMYANLICRIAGVDPNKKAGFLNNQEIEKISDVLSHPDKHNIPAWMKNRRNDVVTGKDRHIITGDLQFQKEQDIRNLMKIKNYRGYRHAAGLPSRGQRTQSNFRRNKGKAVGVKRKAGAKSGRV